MTIGNSINSTPNTLFLQGTSGFGTVKTSGTPVESDLALTVAEKDQETMDGAGAARVDGDILQSLRLDDKLGKLMTALMNLPAPQMPDFSAGGTMT